MNRQYGLTIVELMVAITLALFVVGGTYTIFKMSAVSVASTSHYNQLQDSARMAMRMLQEDIAQAGYFADLTGIDLIPDVNLHDIPSVSSNDCRGAGTNNGSFPNGVGHFRSLWAYNHGSGPSMGCLSGQKSGSDVLQLKRLEGPAIDSGDEQSDRYYFINNFSHGQFYRGSGSTPSLTNGRIWPYQHRVYYVADGNNGVPTLYRRHLTVSDVMSTTEPLVEGVEQINYEFGVDLDRDSFVDSYLNSNQVADELWDKVADAQIVAVRIHLLLITSSEDNNITEDNATTFKLPAGDKVVQADNHRRYLMSSTVMLRNPVITVRE